MSNFSTDTQISFRKHCRYHLPRILAATPKSGWCILQDKYCPENKLKILSTFVMAIEFNQYKHYREGNKWTLRFLGLKEIMKKKNFYGLNASSIKNFS